MIFEKIGPHHLERKAILCVRQSSPHHVQGGDKAGHWTAGDVLSGAE